MELVKDRAIALDDLDAWKQSKNKIVNIGIPAYAILGCLLYSIKRGCNGFIMRKYCRTHIRIGCVWHVEDSLQ